MAGQPGFFDSDERLRALSAAGDPLERLVLVVDFEVFRVELEAALSRSDRLRGGRPPYDPVVMFKILVLRAAVRADHLACPPLTHPCTWRR
jgi:transposase, IS5 family